MLSLTFVSHIAYTRKFDHVTDVISDELHWLPIEQHIEFKICTIVYKCLHNMAPSYLANHIMPVESNVSRRCLRSAVRGDLVVPATRTCYGARSFAVAGPRLWNNLPADIRDRSLSLALFRSKLKTHLFGVAYYC